MDLLVVGSGQQSQQFGRRIVAGKGAEPGGMLPRHQGVVAEIIAGGFGGIAGRKDTGDQTAS